MAPPAKPPSQSSGGGRSRLSNPGLKVAVEKKSSQDRFEDLPVEDIINIMKNPFETSDYSGGLPTPLSGEAT